MPAGKGTLKSLTGRGTVKKTLDRRVDALEASNDKLLRQVVLLESKLGDAFRSLKELVNANNATSILLSSVERFLDGKFGDDWDAGVRKEAEARASLLRRRNEIMVRTRDGGKDLDIKERNDLARELWKIARELDIRGDDTAAVVALHLQNGDVDSSIDIVDEIRRDKVVITEEVKGILGQLLKRCYEIAKKGGNEVLAQRVREVAQIGGS